MKKIALIIACTLFITPVSADFSNAQSWEKYTENFDFADLEKSKADILVIDYAQDGTEQTEFTTQEIAKLQAQGKTILAILPIGQAELYRFYWQADWEVQMEQTDCIERYYNEKYDEWKWRSTCSYGKSPLLGTRNENQIGAYLVRYWQPAWWNLAIEPYLKRITKAGFDGVYLTHIDNYLLWQDYTQRSQAEKMIDLIGKVRNYLGNDYLLVAENGVGLMHDASYKYKRKYKNWPDGIALEHFFYNKKAPRKYYLRLLKPLALRGVKILNMEYISSSLAEKYLTRVAKISFDIVPAWTKTP